MLQVKSINAQLQEYNSSQDYPAPRAMLDNILHHLKRSHHIDADIIADKLYFLSDIQPLQTRSCRHEHAATTEHHHPAEYDQILVVAVRISDEGSTDWIPNKSCNRYSSEHRSSSHPNLPYITDLCYQRWCHRHKRSAAETKESCEQYIGHVPPSREPHAEDEDGGQEGRDDHGIVSAHLVGDPSWYRTTKYRGRIEDRKEVAGQVRAHTIVLC